MTSILTITLIALGTVAANFALVGIVLQALYPPEKLFGRFGDRQRTLVLGVLIGDIVTIALLGYLGWQKYIA